MASSSEVRRRVPRLLAITPPTGVIDPKAPDVWLQSGVVASDLAVLFRDPAQSWPAADLDGWSVLRDRCRALGIVVLASCDAAAALERTDGGALAPYAGVQLRAGATAAIVDTLRRGLDPEAIIGRSCRMGCAFDIGTDYDCLAPIFDPRTPSPGRPKQAIGISALSARCSSSTTPVLALGGLSGSTVEACMRAGAHGLAGIRSFFGETTQVRADVGAMVSALRAKR